MDIIPIETLRAILEIAIEKGRMTYAELWLDAAPLIKYRKQQALIRKLGSVCNRWRSICLELLFEHVWIAPPLESNTLAFRQIFNTDPFLKHSRNPLGWWTRRLYLDIRFLDPPERKALIDHFQINGPFPNVDHLFIFNCGRSGNEENGELILDVYAKYLTSLTLEGSEDTLHRMITRTALGISQLQELVLEFSDDSIPSHDVRDALVLPCVHTLHIHNVTEWEIDGLLYWSFPSMRTLTIYTMFLSAEKLGVFMRMHGPTLTSLSIQYWPFEESFHEVLFGACRALERLEVLNGPHNGFLGRVSVEYPPIMGEHGLREWIFHPFWVDCNLNTFQDSTMDPKFLPSLHKIRILSPEMDNMFSIPLKQVQSLRDWSRALKIRGVLLVDGKDGTFIFLSTTCTGGDSDQCSSSLLRMRTETLQIPEIVYHLYDIPM